MNNYNNLLRGKNLLLMGLYVLVLYTGHMTGFITIVSLFSILVLLLIPCIRYFDTIGKWIIAFTALYCLIGLITGFFSSFSSLLAFSLPLFPFYCFGSYVQENLKSRQYVLIFILVTVTLYSYEIYSTIIRSIATTGSVINVTRLFYFNGDESRRLTATLVGLGASLGFIGLPMALLLKDSKIKRMLFLAVFVCSLLTTIHLVNRTGLVVGVVTMLATCIYYYRSNRKKIIFVIFFCVVLFLVLSYIGVINQEVIDAYTKRNEADLSTGGDRTGRWGYAIEQLLFHPFGWAEHFGTTDVYVHNMWLDIAKVSGIIPFLLLVIPTFMSLIILFRLMRKKQDILVALFISLNTCFFLSCFVEPVYGGLHLFLYVMVWGMQNQYMRQQRFNWS